MEHDCRKEEIIIDIKKHIDNLYHNRDVVLELKTLVNMLVAQTHKQDEILKQQSETMIKINDTVTQQGVLLTQLAAQQNELVKKGSVDISVFERER